MTAERDRLEEALNVKKKTILDSGVNTSIIANVTHVDTSTDHFVEGLRMLLA